MQASGSDGEGDGKAKRADTDKASLGTALDKPRPMTRNFTRPVERARARTSASAGDGSGLNPVGVGERTRPHLG